MKLKDLNSTKLNNTVLALMVDAQHMKTDANASTIFARYYELLLENKLFFGVQISKIDTITLELS